MDGLSQIYTARGRESVFFFFSRSTQKLLGHETGETDRCVISFLITHLAYDNFSFLGIHRARVITVQERNSFSI